MCSFIPDKARYKTGRSFGRQTESQDVKFLHFGITMPGKFFGENSIPINYVTLNFFNVKS